MNVFHLLLLFVSLANGDKVVNTTSGPVRGISLSPKKKVEAFLGIPYAEPPVGPLRFAKPVPKSSWEKVYVANRLPPTCMQFLVTEKLYFSPDAKMSEDCLHLNLWVPEGGSDSKTIMLFIHGGRFMAGSSNTKVYDGANLAQHGDVIVASINYRVGTLGFFYGFTEEAPGNVAMHDQVMAIQWIKENAENFGGNPDNIVLFGESAGAFSVSLHMVSPLSGNLFRRAILQSGTAFGPMFGKDYEFPDMSQSIAKELGCAKEGDSLKENPEHILDCMKRVPTEKFPGVDLFIRQKYNLLLPRFGDEFLPESAMDYFQKANFKDSELLLGVTLNEGPLLITMSMPHILGIFGEKVKNIDLNEVQTRQLFRENLTSKKKPWRKGGRI